MREGSEGEWGRRGGAGVERVREDEDRVWEGVVGDGIVGRGWGGRVKELGERVRRGRSGLRTGGSDGGRRGGGGERTGRSNGVGMFRAGL